MVKSHLVEFQQALLAEKVASKFAKTFPSTKALQDYLSKHPNADARAHKVVRPQDRTEEDKSLADLESRVRHEKRRKPPQPEST